MVPHEGYFFGRTRPKNRWRQVSQRSALNPNHLGRKSYHFRLRDKYTSSSLHLRHFMPSTFIAPPTSFHCNTKWRRRMFSSAKRHFRVYVALDPGNVFPESLALKLDVTGSGIGNGQRGEQARGFAEDVGDAAAISVLHAAGQLGSGVPDDRSVFCKDFGVP